MTGNRITTNAVQTTPGNTQGMVCGVAGRAYLASQGITDAAVIASFRVDAVDEATFTRLGLLGRRKPSGIGICLPTYDPRHPDHIVGVVRLTPVQNKHAFATEPIGIACAADIASHQRIVLVDSPLLGLRLAQAGVPGVAVVEDPAVLPPLVPWLASRAVALVGWRTASIDAMRSALGSLGATATALPVGGDLAHSPSTSLLALGLDPAVVRAKPVKPDLTPIHLRDLIDYARGRLGSGDATQALESVEAHHPALVQAYRIGYLPVDFRRALHRGMRVALAGPRIAGGLILPAFDDQGIAVDALIVHPRVGGRSNDGIAQEPLGLLAPEICRSHDEIIVTDTFRWLARLFHEGYANVQLLRGPADAEQNAARLAAAGVSRATLRVRQHRDRIAEALQGAGISVEVVQAPVTGETEWGDPDSEPIAKNRATPSALDAVSPPAASTASVPNLVVIEPQLPPSPALPSTQPAAPPVVAPVLTSVATADVQLRFVEEDRTAGVFLFEAGPVRYSVQARDDDVSQRKVTARGPGQTQSESFDLAVSRQCERFASGASRRVGIPSAVIAQHLALMWAEVRRREDAALIVPVVAVDPADRTSAEAFLSKPDLLDRIAADLTDLGWMGEERAKRLLYLTAISRFLPQPVWTVYGATVGAAPWQGLSLIRALTPPEDCLVFHRLTDAQLAHTDQRALRHKLLLIDQAETLRPEAALHLRVLNERGGIGWATLGMTGTDSQQRLTGEARGPVAVLAAAAGALERRVRDCFLCVGADESQEATAAVLAEQRRRLVMATAADATSVDPAGIMRRHHAAQRLLLRRPVRIPFADRLIFPTSSVHHREEQAWFLRLVAASAFLHQRQRAHADGAILASEADVALVLGCTAGLLGVESKSISVAARHLLAALYQHKLTSFTMAHLAGVFPDWTRYAFRAALQDLLDFGHLTAPVCGRGTLRQFEMVARPQGADAQASGIRLRPATAPVVAGSETAVGELARVGETDVANFAPYRTGT